MGHDAGKKPKNIDPGLIRFIDGIRDGVVVWGTDGSPLHINSEMRSYDLSGMEPPVSSILRSVKEEGEHESEVELTGPDGKRITLGQRSYPLESNGDRVVCSVFSERATSLSKGRIERQNREFRELVESIGIWIWEMDMEGIHTESNDVVEKILGYRKKEIMGEDTMILWPRRCRTEEQKRRHVRSLKSGEGWRNFQALFEHKNGKPVYTLSSAVPTFDTRGKLTGYKGIDWDITERVLKDKELKEYKEKLESIIRTAVEIIYTQDTDEKISFISPSVKKVLGYEPEDLIGRRIKELIHEDDIHLYKKAISELNETGEPITGSVKRMKHKSGDWVWIKVNRSPITDEEGEIKAILGVMEDYSKKREDDERIVQFNELLKLINKILRHDLTNNLFIIRTALEHYRNVKEETWLDSISTKIDGSLNLIEQMKSLESIVSRGGSLRIVDIREVIERVRSGWDIYVEIECTSRAMADDAFYSVIENLIRNAVVHGKTDRMTFRCMEEDDKIVLDAIDYGVGIPDDIKSDIFTETYKWCRSAGSGLGLYIVKRTVERYGGSIEVLDNRKGGAIFRMRLRKAPRD